MYDVILFKNTHFGHDKVVWNVPSLDYDFSQHTVKTFTNVLKRIPLLATSLILNAEYTKDLKMYDYMSVRDLESGEMTYYFVDGISGDRNIIMVSMMLDVITTYKILNEPISGTLIRKHDNNPNESPYDYPLALQYSSQYEVYSSKIVDYPNAHERRTFIESSVDLTSIPSAKTIISDLGREMTTPILGKTPFSTTYYMHLAPNYDFGYILDTTGALTLYDAKLIKSDTLNTLRGLAGDGAISDSFTIPSSALNVVPNAVSPELISRLEGKAVQVELQSTLLNSETYINQATRGMYEVELSSLASGDTRRFPSWSIKTSIINDKLNLKLSCNPKPSGCPYLSPLNAPINLNKIPSPNSALTLFSDLLKCSVMGGQWVKNPLIYTSGKGEILATVETELQREKSAFERDQSTAHLNISQREKDIRIAQQKYNYEVGQVGTLMSIAGDVLTGDLGGVMSGVSSVYIDRANQQYIRELQQLKSYENSVQGNLIKIAHRNNLRSLNVQENIRRVVAPEVTHRENDSLKSYNYGNTFRVSIISPNEETLIQKDMEFSLYGYPVMEKVQNFVMNNLRKNHSVFQFDSPILNFSGEIGELVSEYLRSGIRILRKPYSANNLLNNPKE